MCAGRQVTKKDKPELTPGKMGPKSSLNASRSFKLYHLRRVPMRLSARFMTVLLLCTVFIATSRARVVRVEIASRTDIDNGKPFGSAGAYEKLKIIVESPASP